MNGTCAEAHPNIALIKYWGKQLNSHNFPTAPSLSITLDTLTTTTRVEAADTDRFHLNGECVQEPKILNWLTAFRREYSISPVEIQSTNNFPTASGLASSASGFAAMVTAIDAAFDLKLSDTTKSSWARRGSGSAARSIFGGFVTLSEKDGDWIAEQLLDSERWPLEVVIAVTSDSPKHVSSTEGMLRSQKNIHAYAQWLHKTRMDYEPATAAVLDRNFETLAEISESSYRAMHSLMAAARPSLIYMNPTTRKCIAVVEQMKTRGMPLFCTVDAGPQVKVICNHGYGSEVASQLRNTSGVHNVVKCGLGDGARIVKLS